MGIRVLEVIYLPIKSVWCMRQYMLTISLITLFILEIEQKYFGFCFFTVLF